MFHKNRFLKCFRAWSYDRIQNSLNFWVAKKVYSHRIEHSSPSIQFRDDAHTLHSLNTQNKQRGAEQTVGTILTWKSFAHIYTILWTHCSEQQDSCHICTLMLWMTWTSKNTRYVCFFLLIFYSWNLLWGHRPKHWTYCTQSRDFTTQWLCKILFGEICTWRCWPSVC